MAASLFLAPVAQATSLDQQIAELSQQAKTQQAQANALHGQSDTLANKLGGINSEAAALATQISLNKAKQQRLLAQIEAAKIELEKQKAILDENIRQIYQESQITPLEMLASSRNFSDYVDKQQYLDRIKDSVIEASEQVRKTKADLENQQTAVENLIKQQADYQQSLAIKQNEAARILSETRGEESRYAEMAKANNAQVEALRAKQAAILAATFGGSASGGAACGGGYPGIWCNIPKDTAIDNWGMYNRECVSYTAFRVASSGRRMPYWGGRGNANQWPDNARAAGISVNGSPEVGDVAVTLAGPYGHVMYVERVNGNGTIFVSQYNYGNGGEYSTMTIPASGLQFIHF